MTDNASSNNAEPMDDEQAAFHAFMTLAAIEQELEGWLQVMKPEDEPDTGELPPMFVESAHQLLRLIENTRNLVYPPNTIVDPHREQSAKTAIAVALLMKWAATHPWDEMTSNQARDNRLALLEISHQLFLIDRATIAAARKDLNQMSSSLIRTFST
jgi:hypothetical protein